MEFYLWLDRFDSDMVSIGKKTKWGWTCWGQIHIDGIGEIFGEWTLRQLKFARDEKNFDPIRIVGAVIEAGDEA